MSIKTIIITSGIFFLILAFGLFFLNFQNNLIKEIQSVSSIVDSVAVNQGNLKDIPKKDSIEIVRMKNRIHKKFDWFKREFEKVWPDLQTSYQDTDSIVFFNKIDELQSIIIREQKNNDLEITGFIDFVNINESDSVKNKFGLRFGDILANSDPNRKGGNYIDETKEGKYPAARKSIITAYSKCKDKNYLNGTSGLFAYSLIDNSYPVKRGIKLGLISKYTYPGDYKTDSLLLLIGVSATKGQLIHQISKEKEGWLMKTILTLSPLLFLILILLIFILRTVQSDFSSFFLDLNNLIKANQQKLNGKYKINEVEELKIRINKYFDEINQLNQQKNEYDFALNNAVPFAIAIAKASGDEKGKIIWQNQEHINWYGIAEDKLIWDLSDTIEVTKEKFEECINSSEGKSDYMSKVKIDSDGILVNTQFIKYKSIVVCADSDHLKAQNIIYFNTIAHDLRNNYEGYLGRIDALLSNTKISKGNLIEGIKGINYTLEKDIDLIRNLSAWAHMNAHSEYKFQIVPTLIDVEKFLNEIIERQKKLHGPNIKFSIIIEHRINCYADPMLLKLIFNNLIDNAIKYSRKFYKEKQIVTIKVDSDKYYSNFFVHNHGPSIPEERRKLLFNSNLMGNSRSTGIGLLVSSYLAKEMNGMLSLEKSNELDGTIFKLSLPKNYN